MWLGRREGIPVCHSTSAEAGVRVASPIEVQGNRSGHGEEPRQMSREVNEVGLSQAHSMEELLSKEMVDEDKIM